MAAGDVTARHRERTYALAVPDALTAISKIGAAPPRGKVVITV